MTTLAKRVGVTQKEVKRWIDGKAIPHGGNADALIQECSQVGINWRKYKGLIPVYDFHATYERNVSDGPQGLPSRAEGWIPPIPIRLFDEFDINSPIGVPASVLTINSQWIERLTNLGFDIITSKTVRTTRVPSHPFPNVVYVPDIHEPLAVGSLPSAVRGSQDLSTEELSGISLANSFGMPSPDVREWQADLEATLKLLKPGQILIVSVVGTADDGRDLVNDFVDCAHRAYEVTPHAIELNFSCVNAYGREGSLYQNPEIAATICQRIRNELPLAKIIIKLGYLNLQELSVFFEATHRFVDGYTAINTLAAEIVSDGQQKEPVFPGSNRGKAGLSGVAIRRYALEVVKNLRILANKKPELTIIGVGGISSGADVVSFREAGANAVQICSAALLNPLIAVEIRRQLVRENESRSRSRILERSGMSIPFSDLNTAKAFDTTLKVCERMEIPFEIGFAAVQKHWLNGYLSDLREIKQSSNSPHKTRRDGPTESQIESWINDELKKTR